MVCWALYVFWSTSVYFGDSHKKTYSMGPTLISIVALFVLGLRPIIQQAPEGTDKLKLINQLWTERGLANPMAVVCNFFIVLCWTLAIVAFTILIPPYRTARSTLSTAVLPGAIKQSVAVLTGKLSKDVLVGSSDLLDQGAIAKLALFEPPEIPCKHGFLVEELTALTVSVDNFILAALAFRSLLDEERSREKCQESSQDKGIDAMEREIAMAITEDERSREEVITLLLKTAKALASTDVDDTNDLNQHTIIQNAEETLGPCYRVYEIATKVRDAALVYLKAWDGIDTGEEAEIALGTRAQDFIKTKLVVWMVSPLMGWPRTMLKALLTPFYPSTWNLQHFLWGLKITAGAVVLFGMTMCWDAYANFAISRDDWKIGSVFYGWDLLGYTNSWRPTVEGTFKKGGQRVIGTCIAGFLAWIGIIICSGSCSEDAAVNPYGLIAYCEHYGHLHISF